MKAGWILAMAFWLSLPCTARASEIENGGTAILHATYTVDMVEGNCNTLVIVTSEEEIARIIEVIRESKETVFFQLDDSDQVLRLKSLSGNRLGGRVLGSGRRVLVVSHEYAHRNGFDAR